MCCIQWAKNNCDKPTYSPMSPYFTTKKSACTIWFTICFLIAYRSTYKEMKFRNNTVQPFKENDSNKNDPFFEEIALIWIWRKGPLQAQRNNNFYTAVNYNMSIQTKQNMFSINMANKCNNTTILSLNVCFWQNRSWNTNILF